MENQSMPTRISRDNVFFAFSPALTAAARVQQGEEVLLETHDCFQGQLKSEADLITALDWSHVNPATGPVYIEGARPGDVLRVDLLEVNIGDQSTMVTIPGEGALGDVITQMETAVLKRQGDEILFHDLRVPKHPMIGVIGVAPAEGEVPNGTPGPHGGNMDCKLIGAGSSLFLTVGVEGALFGAGDLHAAMGDGEIVVCGAETPGEVRFRAQVVGFPGLPTPFIINDEVAAVIVAAPTADEAAAEATHRMARFLTDFTGLPLNDAGMLMSLVGELKFCQVVDPLKTVRFEFPTWVLDKLAPGYLKSMRG
jgi:amidase